MEPHADKQAIETMGTSRYVAKKPDANGIIHYTQAEHDVWRDLYARQITKVPKRACQAYLDGLAKLQLSTTEIPQPSLLSDHLETITGWRVEPVPAMISYEAFFDLLKNRRFPAASFIRHRDEFDYLQEPDIFHEIFGHCPMLTDQTYGDFMQKYGELGLAADEQTREYLARLYWFTVEFGLINTADGSRAYGGGILSSPEETVYAVESPTATRQTFELATVLRTPYRIDILQPIYFVIESFDALYDLLSVDLNSAIQTAIAAKDFPPLFPLKQGDQP